jgi:hypothetical protein
MVRTRGSRFGMAYRSLFDEMFGLILSYQRSRRCDGGFPFIQGWHCVQRLSKLLSRVARVREMRRARIIPIR